MASVDDHAVVIVARRLFIHNTDELADSADDHVMVAAADRRHGLRLRGTDYA